MSFYGLIKLVPLCLFMLMTVCCTKRRVVKHPVIVEATISHLLSRYKDLPFDTVAISQDLITVGTPLDSMDLTLFPNKKYGYEKTREYGYGYYGLYKFQLDSAIGLITREPSDYEPSSIRLYLLSADGKITRSEWQLAEGTGDDGEYIEIKSVIMATRSAVQFIICERHLRLKVTTVTSWDSTTFVEGYYHVRLKNGETELLDTDERILQKLFEGSFQKKRE